MGPSPIWQKLRRTLSSHLATVHMCYQPTNQPTNHGAVSVVMGSINIIVIIILENYQ